jgi:hypothetical protein
MNGGAFMDCYSVAAQWGDSCEGQVATRGRLLFLCVVSYLLLGWCCWTELRYRRAIELPAQFNVVGNVIHGGRHGPREMHCLRYWFQDPVTGRRYQNTVEIAPSEAPAGQRVMVQYLSGEFPESRLAIQARPVVVTVFYSITALLALMVVGAVFWLSVEAHAQPPRGVRSLTPVRRRIEIS